MNLGPLAYLANNWISRIGVIAVTTAAVFWLFLLFQGDVSHPYLGLLTALALPGIFFLGLLLIPLGIWRRRRTGEVPDEFRASSWQNPHFRQIVTFVVVATVANLIIASQFTVRAVHYMESNAFCGITCHNVMKPQYTAHKNSVHANVACVQCHVGPGAEWFVRSKIAGVNQLVQLAAGTYPKPVPPPSHMRAAAETCGGCHTLRNSKDRVKVFDKFADDEKNTHTQTVLVMRTGDIHRAHASIRFAHADVARQEISWIQRPAPDGKMDTFKSDVKSTFERQMDCTDCHNRHGHAFVPPDRALDQAMASAKIPATLPFVKREAMRLLEKGGGNLAEFYRKNHPGVLAQRRPEIDRADAAVAAIRQANVFPEMNVGWRTYIDNGGHTDSPGCFRCHDGERSTTQGKQLGQDCAACHTLVAVDESNPKILSDLGIAQKEQSQ